MNYEINVSKNGKHFFATSPRSITSLPELERMYDTFLEKFPEAEGYSIMVFEETTTSHIINMKLQRDLKQSSK